MPARDILEGLAIPKTSKKVAARRKVVLNHPLVHPDYSIKRGDAKKIVGDLRQTGFKATTGTVRYDLLIYKTVYAFLTDPVARDRIKQRIESGDHTVELVGAKALFARGINTLDDLPLSQATKEAEGKSRSEELAAQAVIAEEKDKFLALAIKDLGGLVRIGEAARFLLDFVEKIQEEATWGENEITYLKSENLEISKRVAALERENTLLAEMAEEVEEKLSALRSVVRRESPTKIPVTEKVKPEPKRRIKRKPPTPSLPTIAVSFGNARIEYEKEFLDLFEERLRQDQQKIVRALENIHPFNNSSTRVRTVKPEQHIRGLPLGSLLTKAGVWRIGWRKEDDGKIHVYNIIHRGDSALGYDER